jgi:hypothetical protein
MCFSARRGLEANRVAISFARSIKVEAGPTSLITGPGPMVFAEGQPEGWINTQKSGVVTIFITRSYRVNSLLHHLD